MLNYKKLMEHKPFVYDTLVNSLGQTIELIEHPTKGDEAPIICVCHELKLADYSTFYDTDDMLAEETDYEPNFRDGELYIGDFTAR